MADVPQRHRQNFSKLLAANPNYFGNLPGSALQPALTLVADTSYEQLTCVGYQPARRLLEATFQIKLPYGFGGRLCTAGSWEYVRFWLDYGTGWVDAGLTAVNVHDLPDGVDCAGAEELPVSYVATLPLDPRTSFCDEPVLPRVRAILSWNVEPPDTPSPAVPVPADWQPVFGNVLETHIQIAPRRLFLADVLKTLHIDAATLPDDMQPALQVPIPVPDPAPLSVAHLAKLYGDKVPAHRFGAGALASALSGGSPFDTLAAIQSWQGIGIDWPGAVAKLVELDGDVDYEQLTCAGLDVARSRLVATIRIKRPTGYLGDLCHRGSTEYVAFWGDFGDSDCTLTYLGTAEVPVHDIAHLPKDGLSYAAVLPVDLSAWTRPCDEPVLGRIRAVLSWNTPPSTVDPDAVPFWGNRLDVHVQVPVRSPGSGTGPNIFAIGGIGVADLDTGNGMTKPGAHFALTGGFTDPRQCPFGGEVVVQGEPVPGGRYRVQVRNLTTGGGWTSLVNPVAVVDHNGVFGSNAPTGEYYPYLDHAQNEDAALANWNTFGDDLWELKLDAVDAGGTPLGEITYRIQLDNTAPVVDIHIDNGGDCKKFTVGDPINGHVFAVDPNHHFGSWSLAVLPDNLPGGTGVLTPASGTAETAPAPGDAWHLTTAGMSTCAYVVTAQARDRTIVSSSTVGWPSNTVAVGFSLG